MSLLDPAANAPVSAPLFDIKGSVAGIDLSAWISGAMLAIGISRVGPAEIAADFNAGGFGLYLIIGAYVTFLAFVMFMQAQMRIQLSAKSFGEAQSLVTHGLFKFTRNPIYLAFFLPLGSLAYFSTHTAVAAIVIYVTLMNIVVIAREENDLQRRFGKTFTDYRAAVPRWFA
jgi:protein-S-isoprenylcysteine O-methyltransferase Ste14